MAVPVKYGMAESLSQQERELARIYRYKQSVYQDWKDGEISRQDYRRMAEDYEQQARTLEEALAALRAEQAETGGAADRESPLLASLRQRETIGQLTRDVLIALVDHIEVYENGRIRILFRFSEGPLPC